MLTSNEEIERERLRTLILSELRGAGWDINSSISAPPRAEDKEEMRRFHKAQRIERADQEWRIVEKHGGAIIQEFANGSEISPKDFSPKLIRIEANSWETQIFRFASLWWSIPVSKGYGRRMRYLVKDESNDKLVGIFALGDPIFNLKMRDEVIGWNSEQRKERLYHMMDAYVLGALPPYNQLLAGKFIALTTISDEIRKDFGNKYRGKATIIDEKMKEASLVLVSTTSAMGRSSIYNRLRLPHEDELAFKSVGYSQGWGHFHISNNTFMELRDWLRSHGEIYADGHKFGQGPNWKMRTIRRAVDLLGFNVDLLWHGLKREIFLAPNARNYREYLRGEQNRPRYYKNRDLATINEFFKERWMVPRSERTRDWITWTRQDTWGKIMANCARSDIYRMF